MSVKSKVKRRKVKRLPLSVLVKRAERQGKKSKYQATLHDARTVWSALNHAVFGGVLNLPEKFIVQNRSTWDFWGECEGWIRGSRWGQPYTKAIRLQRIYRNPKTFIDVMAHEMVHQYEWERQGVMSHGRTFFAWKEKLEEKGIPLDRGRS